MVRRLRGRRLGRALARPNVSHVQGDAWARRAQKRAPLPTLPSLAAARVNVGSRAERLTQLRILPRWIGSSPSLKVHARFAYARALQVTKTPGFIERHGLWSDEQRRQAEEVKRRIEQDKLALIRLAWADPHGAARAKAVTVPAFLAALNTGYNINVATTTLDSANARTFASFTRGGGMGLDEMTGSPNITIVPDPVHLSRAAVGIRRRLGAVRRVFQQRRAVPLLDRGSCCARQIAAAGGPAASTASSVWRSSGTSRA